MQRKIEIFLLWGLLGMGFIMGQASATQKYTQISSEKSTQKPPEITTQKSTQKSISPQSSLFELDYGLDAYYSSIGIIANFTREPIPDYSDRSENDLYFALLKDSLSPRFLLLEASVNPMPVLGMGIRHYYPEIYHRAQIADSFNLVKSATFGFEEPYAVSLFLGSIAKFKEKEEINLLKELGHNTAYVGFLFSVGNYHIKDNVPIEDWWYEVEWKIKGDRNFLFSSHSWSFRFGAKVHANKNIASVGYIGLRRDRLDLLRSGWSIWHNSGFEYRFDMKVGNLAWMRHVFQVDKKWPLGKSHTAFKLNIGFIIESQSKYTGVLSDRRPGQNMQFLIQPNLVF